MEVEIMMNMDRDTILRRARATAAEAVTARNVALAERGHDDLFGSREAAYEAARQMSLAFDEFRRTIENDVAAVQAVTALERAAEAAISAATIGFGPRSVALAAEVWDAKRVQWGAVGIPF